MKYVEGFLFFFYFVFDVIAVFMGINLWMRISLPSSSTREHLNYDVCLEKKREDWQNFIHCIHSVCIEYISCTQNVYIYMYINSS